MSWDAYSQVLIDGGCKSAGLYGFDGSCWSQVGEFAPSAAEAKALVAGLCDNGAALQGIYFNGVKYMKIGGMNLWKKGASSVAAAATGHCWVIGCGDMTSHASLRRAVEDLAADIKSKGY